MEVSMEVIDIDSKESGVLASPILLSPTNPESFQWLISTKFNLLASIFQKLSGGACPQTPRISMPKHEFHTPAINLLLKVHFLKKTCVSTPHNFCLQVFSYIAGIKITVSHQLLADQISNIAAHFLICLTYFRSNKRLCIHRRQFRFDTFQFYYSKYTIICIARWEVYTMVYGIYLVATNSFVYSMIEYGLLTGGMSVADLTFNWLLLKTYFHPCIVQHFNDQKSFYSLISSYCFLE